MNSFDSQRPALQGQCLELLAQRLAATLQGDGAVRARGLHHDSRLVQPGDLFVARRGEHSDGLAYVDQALAKGAVAVLAERAHPPRELSVPVLLVDDIRLALGKAASLLYGQPSDNLQVVGITGTNGKTTTSYLVSAAVDGAGGRCGVLGTLGARLGELKLPGNHTTPEADELARVASALRSHGASHLVMEVSSHALDQHRADEVHYRVAAFTNLTQDHLDYHHTLEAYAAAKARLFTDLAPQSAVLNIDDPFGLQLASLVRCPCIRVSRDASSQAEIRPASAVQQDIRGIHCEVSTPAGPVSLHSPLVGEHNLSNLLLALGIAVALELPVQKAAQALGQCPGVPGRLERCDGPEDNILVLVDYAHTPDALERALRTLRPLTRGRLLCVFGCGGDRDRGKRPVMGQVVGQLADVALLTNDNPRTEAPESIAQAVLQGLRGGSSKVVVELDREKAIVAAIEQALPGDVVLVAGKGHEPYQIIGAESRPFDDRLEARKALAQRRSWHSQKAQA